MNLAQTVCIDIRIYEVANSAFEAVFCNLLDGLLPVIFMVEVTDEESVSEYTPVER